MITNEHTPSLKYFKVDFRTRGSCFKEFGLVGGQNWRRGWAQGEIFFSLMADGKSGSERVVPVREMINGGKGSWQGSQQGAPASSWVLQGR